jgi:hypothetical protein
MQAIAQSGASRRNTRQVRAVVLVFALIASVLVAVSPASAATPDTNTWYQLINRHSGQARLPTLMHDAPYRLAVAWQNVAYNQPPHPSFHLGDGMAVPPMPNIYVR